MQSVLSKGQLGSACFVGRRLKDLHKSTHRRDKSIIYSIVRYQGGMRVDSNDTRSQREVDTSQNMLGTFEELGLDKSLYDKTGGIRFRQHVNPLKRELQEPVKPLNWNEIFEDPKRPLVLDIGAGYGRFLLGLCQLWTEKNGLGLEIREPIIKRANTWAHHLDLSGRVHFVKANATVSIASMLHDYPGDIELVTIQYPDPHFKKKHRKRRVVQTEMVESLLDILCPEGKVLLQSDVLEVAVDMRDKFEVVARDRLQPSVEHRDEAVFYEENIDDEELDPSLEWKKAGWLKQNPLPVPTERECHVLEQGLPVYRVMLTRTIRT